MFNHAIEMKIYIVKTFFVWLVAVGLLSACGSDAKKVKENDIRFDTIAVKESYHMKKIETNPGCSLQINFLFPAEYQNPHVLKAVQQQFIKTFLGDDYMQFSPREAVSQYAANYLNDFKKRETDFESDVEEHGSEPNDEWYSSYEILGDSIYYNQNDLSNYMYEKNFTLEECYTNISLLNRANTNLNLGLNFDSLGIAYGYFRELSFLTRTY